MPTDEDWRERVYKQGDDNSKNVNGLGTREDPLKVRKSSKREEDTHSGNEFWRLYVDLPPINGSMCKYSR